MKKQKFQTMEKRRGIIIFSQEFLYPPIQQHLSVVFSNFFPMKIEYRGEENVKMIGYSQHFREIEEGMLIPTYEMFLTIDEFGVKFNKMVELS